MTDKPTARLRKEGKELLDSLGVADLLLREGASNLSPTSDEGAATAAPTGMHPALKAGLAVGLVVNLGVLLSLPPVVMSKGAPYLPTFSRASTVMFDRIRQNRNITARIKDGTPLKFVDLGSGDGRLVFQAARQNLFSKAYGFEINPGKTMFYVCRCNQFKHGSALPLTALFTHTYICAQFESVLHAFACSRRIVQAPKYWSSTEFGLRDLWKVELGDVDVVAIYGLQPIMKDLRRKLQQELRPGSVVVSNVFSIPGWRQNGGSKGGVFIYSVPDCWKKTVGDGGSVDGATY